MSDSILWDDMAADHAAGRHRGETARRGHDGEPGEGCEGCMDDEIHAAAGDDPEVAKFAALWGMPYAAAVPHVTDGRRRAADLARVRADHMAPWCPWDQWTPHEEWAHLCDCEGCTAAANAINLNLVEVFGCDPEEFPALLSGRHPDFDKTYLRSWALRLEVHADRVALIDDDDPYAIFKVDPLWGWPVRLDWDAKPPPDKFDLLALIEPRFERSYRRRRPDMRDQSDSSYDFSLAYFGFDTAWSIQEVADLLIAGRRDHGDPTKSNKALRRDYIERTLIRALLSVARRTVQS